MSIYWLVDSYQAFPLLVKVLISLCLLFTVLGITFFALSGYSRILASINNRRREKIKHRYIELIIPLIFEESGTKEAYDKALHSFRKEFLGKRGRRQLLLNVLVEQHDDLSGEAAQRVRQVYIDLELFKDSFAKLKDYQWHIKVKGIRELAQMQVSEASKNIEGFIDSKNTILAKEALLGLVQLREFKALAYINRYRYELSDWQMLSILEVLSSFDRENIPSFARWLDSEKNSMVIFCLRLIAVFHQREAEYQVVKLLENKERSIRKEAVRTMRALQLNNHVDLIVGIYQTETKDVRLEILGAVGDLSMGEQKQFLEGEFLQPDFEISFAAAEALMKTSYNSKNDFKQLSASFDETHTRIIDHVTHEMLKS